MLTVTTVISVALFVVMKIQKNENDKEKRRGENQDVKQAVIIYMLTEYQKGKAVLQDQLEKAHSELILLEEAVNTAWAKADEAKGEMDVCEEAKVGRKMQQRECEW